MSRITAATLLALALAGCLFNPFSRPSPSPGADSGFLVLEVTDAPMPGLRQLNVTISDFSASSGGKWKLFSKAAQTFDLIALANKTAPAGRFALAPGAYEKLGFKVKSVSAAFAEKPKECLSLPFGEAPARDCTPELKKYPVKVAHGSVEAYYPFSILLGTDTRLIIDLDAESLRSDLGKYSFEASARVLSPDEFKARFFNPLCGDGYCQKISCTGAGCPALETPENCPQDCAAATAVPPAAGGECAAFDGICCLKSDPAKCSESLLACTGGSPAVFKGCEYREGACFSVSECEG